MKIFLGLIAVLMAVGAGFLMLSGTQYRAAEKDVVRANEAAEQARLREEDADRAAREALARTSSALPAPAAETSESVPVPAPASEKAAPSAALAEEKKDIKVEDVLASLPTASSEPKVMSPPVSAPPAPAKAAAKSSDEPAYEVTPTTIQPQDDGTSLVDGKYTIKGDGSVESPYVVPWELLTSVEHTYNPAEGKKKISEGVAMLDGKYVRLNGYIAFPMMVQQPRELLSMLNQWDGCCIGVPPTPYDAVEVRLKDKVTGQKRFMTAGSVVGVFRVKPYLTGKWLVGLWVMDDGEIVSEKYGAGGT
jgi:hypothetical protein